MWCNPMLSLRGSPVRLLAGVMIITVNLLNDNIYRMISLRSYDESLRSRCSRIDEALSVYFQCRVSYTLDLWISICIMRMLTDRNIQYIASRYFSITNIQCFVWWYKNERLSFFVFVTLSGQCASTADER